MLSQQRDLLLNVWLICCCFLVLCLKEYSYYVTHIFSAKVHNFMFVSRDHNTIFSKLQAIEVIFNL